MPIKIPQMAALMTDEVAVASYLHSAWMDWAGTILEQEPISDERAARWIRCMVPYLELPNEEREKDLARSRILLDSIRPIIQRAERRVAIAECLEIMRSSMKLGVTLEEAEALIRVLSVEGE